MCRPEEERVFLRQQVHATTELVGDRIHKRCQLISPVKASLQNVDGGVSANLSAEVISSGVIAYFYSIGAGARSHLTAPTRFFAVPHQPSLRHVATSGIKPRIVSAARFQLRSPGICATFQRDICADISEFESYMPSQAVRLQRVTYEVRSKTARYRAVKFTGLATRA